MNISVPERTARRRVLINVWNMAGMWVFARIAPNTPPLTTPNLASQFLQIMPPYSVCYPQFSSPWADPGGGCKRCAPPPSPFRPKVPFFVEVCNFQTKIFPRNPEKALVHCTKSKMFPRKKPAFFATRKDVKSYTQMPGKRILTL
jgi:hypothetical protein